MSPCLDPDVFRCVGDMTFQAASLLKSLLIEMLVASKRTFYYFWHDVKQQYGHSAVI